MAGLGNLQKALLEFMLADEGVFTRAHSIIKAGYFDSEFQEAIKFINDYADSYHAVPNRMQIHATTGLLLEPPDNLSERECQWVLDEIERFCKRRALEQAIFRGHDLIQEDRFGEVEGLVKEAMQVSLNRGIGTSYYEDPRGRASRLRDRNNTVSTGWMAVDKVLFGGFNRGELNIFAGGSGAGKSLLLQGISRNWSIMGKVVLYISLELSEELIAQRIDAMNMKMSTKDIWPELDNVELTIRRMGRDAGVIQIRQLPAGTTTNDLRAFVKEFEIQTGLRPDAIVIDYLDLMHPNNNRVDVSNLFVKDKFVSEELRGFASENHFLCASASQLNRSAVDAQDGHHTHAHISGGISKINTADNVATIYAPDDLKAKERIRLQWIKTRNSSGVGKKVWLHYDPVSMRISDLDESEQEPVDEGPDDADLIDSLGNLRRSILNRSRSGNENETARREKLRKEHTQLRSLANSIG